MAKQNGLIILVDIFDMKKIIFLLVCLLAGMTTMSAQIRFSASANVYNDKNNRNVGTQYISADISSNGIGTMTLGSITMNAVVTNSKRDNTYNMTAYSVSLRSRSGKTVDAVSTKRDKGTCTVLVYYADGTLRYDFSL